MNRQLLQINKIAVTYGEQHEFIENVQNLPKDIQTKLSKIDNSITIIKSRVRINVSRHKQKKQKTHNRKKTRAK